MEQDRRGDVVRDVAGDLELTRPSGEFGQVQFQDIGKDDLHRFAGKGLLHPGDHPLVQVHDHQPSGQRGKLECQRPFARTDLQDRIRRSGAEGGHDLMGGVPVAQEVLAEGSAGAQRGGSVHNNPFNRSRGTAMAP